MTETNWSHEELYAWMRTLSEQQIYYLCNAGWYNDIMKGYLVRAAKIAKISRKGTDKLLHGMHWALDEMDAKEAKEEYWKY